MYTKARDDENGEELSVVAPLPLPGKEVPATLRSLGSKTDSSIFSCVLRLMDEIRVKGARMHNLKNISVSIPRNKLTVITGLSGSGKSSLAFDTIFAEGQRRYVEY